MTVTQHQGEKDAKGPTDFANSTASTRFDDDEGDDDEPDDEEEYTPNRGVKRRKMKKSSRTVNANADVCLLRSIVQLHLTYQTEFENNAASMAIPQPPIPSMHTASSLPVSSDRHAFREGPGMFIFHILFENQV